MCCLDPPHKRQNLQLPLFIMMSTLCCGLVDKGFGGGDAAAVAAHSEALSPVMIHVPHRGTGSSGELSGDDPATTPEASTDSENDSSFESDMDDARNMSSIRRKGPSSW